MSNPDTFFRQITVLNQALSERAFVDAPAPSDTPASARAILWLGCNVLRTPHLTELAARVVQRAAGNPVSVLGGPAHCCGVPLSNRDDGERMLRRTVAQFQGSPTRAGVARVGTEDEPAPTVISWCPSCHTRLRESFDEDFCGFAELHVTEFLARHLDRLALQPRVRARVLLHGHTGTPDRDRDMDNCRRLLLAIPGISVVAEHADPDLGLHCVPSVLKASLGAEAMERKLAATLARARACGADMLVTIYHSCYRELEKRLPAARPAVENYITLLAQALDIAVPANLYREVAHAGPARLVQIIGAAQARALDRGELERAIKAEFPAVRLPDEAG